jgi:hypothetical protein
MADRVATTPAPTVARGDRQAPATDDFFDVSTRELAQRRSGEIEVFLLWHSALDRVELHLLDLATGVSLHLDVPPDRALDAFYHPFAYVTQPGSSSAPSLD